MSCKFIIIIIILIAPHSRAFQFRAKLPGGTRTTWSEAATGKPKGSQETGVTILQTPDTRPFQPQDQEKCSKEPGRLPARRSGRQDEFAGLGKSRSPRARARWVTRSRATPTWPRRGPRNLAAPAPPAARGAPPRLPAQPRPPPSPVRVRVPPLPPPPPRAVGEGPRHLSPTGRENKAAAARTFFGVCSALPQRLLTEAGSAAVGRVGARQRPRPGAGASEASRASHEPARRPRPFLLPSLPSRLEAGGRGAGARGRGRAARAGPAGSCSSPPCALVGLVPRGARGGSAPRLRSPTGDGRGVVRDSRDALYSNLTLLFSRRAMAGGDKR